MQSRRTIETIYGKTAGLILNFNRLKIKLSLFGLTEREEAVLEGRNWDNIRKIQLFASQQNTRNV